MTATSTLATQRASIREVGLRDGLQSLASIVSTADKCAWIDAAYDAGMREMEVGSMVPAHLLPQLADTEAVLAMPAANRACSRPC